MLKKEITSTDFNGVTTTEAYYFNLTQAEITEMEMGTTGSFSEMLQRIIDARDMASIIKVVKDLILKSYGIKSLDGKRFEKSPEISEAFAQTNAYSVLFMELATDDNAAADFVNGIMPEVPKTNSPVLPTTN